MRRHEKPWASSYTFLLSVLSDRAVCGDLFVQLNMKERKNGVRKFAAESGCSAYIVETLSQKKLQYIARPLASRSVCSPKLHLDLQDGPKSKLLYFFHIFAKYWPIFTIFYQ